MTEIKVDLRRMQVKVQGHAGAGQKGADLVCAGVTALTNALLARAPVFGGECSIGADALVEVRFPTGGRRRRIATASVRTGFAMTGETGEQREDEGRSFGLRPQDDTGERDCREMLRTVAEGWLVLAEQYPEHVRVSLEE